MAASHLATHACMDAHACIALPQPVRREACSPGAAWRAAQSVRRRSGTPRSAWAVAVVTPASHGRQTDCNTGQRAATRHNASQQCRVAPCRAHVGFFSPIRFSQSRATSSHAQCCVRACVRAWVRVCVRACVRARVCGARSTIAQARLQRQTDRADLRVPAWVGVSQRVCAHCVARAWMRSYV